MQFSGRTALFIGIISLFSATLSTAAAINVAVRGDALKWETYLYRANVTANVLINDYYTEDDGQFHHLWWNSAITYSELIDLSALLNEGGKVAGHDLHSMLSNVYAKHTGSTSVSNNNFLNPYYDDEGWWALTWIAAYDLTKEAKYLAIAETIIANMWETGQACGNGIWWSKSKKVVTTVENVLLMSVAAHLANRVSGSNVDKYKDIASKSWGFLQDSGAWNPEKFSVGGNIRVSSCKIDTGNGPAPYTQGVIIGGFLEFAKLFGDDSYINLAKNVALATITDFTSKTAGIFSESRTVYTNDLAQFKGVFLRYLMILNRSYPDTAYVDFTTKNADSIWDHARNANGTFIVLWQGNPDNLNLGDYSPEVGTSSANQCQIAAAEMVKGGKLGITVD